MDLDHQPVEPHIVELLAQEEINHRRDIAKLNGVCTRCFAEKTTPPYFVCDICREKQIDGRRQKTVQKREEAEARAARRRKGEIDRAVDTVQTVAAVKRETPAVEEPKAKPDPVLAVKAESLNNGITHWLDENGRIHIGLADAVVPPVAPVTENVSKNPAIFNTSPGPVKEKAEEPAQAPLAPLEASLLRMPGLYIKIDQSALPESTRAILYDLIIGFLKLNLRT